MNKPTPSHHATDSPAEPCVRTGAAPAAPPPLRRQTIPFLFSPALTRKLCTVVAPAGYGKTLSLSLFAESTEAEMDWRWISLLPRDGGVRQLLGHLSRTLHSLDAHLGEAISMLQDELSSAAALTAAAATPESQAASLGARTGALLENYLTGDLALVLDDYHAVQHAPGIQNFVTALIAAMPAWCHLFLVSRDALHLELTRYRTAGHLLSVTKTDLRFSDDDVKAYLASRIPNHTLSPETVARLTALTEGWAAGVVLLAESLRTRFAAADAGGTDAAASSPVDIPDALFTEETLRDYLLSEFFSTQAEPEQALLLATSIAESFDAPLAARLLEVFQRPADGNAATGSQLSRPVADAESDEEASVENILHTLVGASLLEPVRPAQTGDGLYRQPRYLRDFLRARLSPELLRRLAAACGSLYQERGSALPAAEYFLLAADGEQAISALERIVDTDAGTPLTVVRDLLQRASRLDISDAARATLYALQAQTEQQLGDIASSEAYIELCYAALRATAQPATPPLTPSSGKPARKSPVKSGSTAADDARRREYRTQRLTLLRLENLMYQSRHAALLSESHAFIRSLSAPPARHSKRAAVTPSSTNDPLNSASSSSHSASSSSHSASSSSHSASSSSHSASSLSRLAAPDCLARALALYAFALARTDNREETLLHAMTLFEEALTHTAKLTEPLFVKVKAAVLKLRYLVAQELGLRAGAETFADYEKFFPHLTPKVRLDALKDRAFDLVLRGDFAAARPLILEASNGADRTAYTRVFFATKFLFAECLSAEGKFDQAASRYSEVTNYYASFSPSTALMMLFGATVNAYYLGDTALCERQAREARDLFVRIAAPTAYDRAAYLSTLFFAALAVRDELRACRVMTELQALVSNDASQNLVAETHLFNAYFAAVTPSDTPSTFVQAAAQYLSGLELDLDIYAPAQGYPYLSLKCHWRLAETVLLKLRTLKASPAETDAETCALLQKIDSADIDRLLRVLIDHKTSLGILGNDSGIAARSHTPHKFIRITTLGDFRVALEGVPDASDAVIDGGSFPRRNIKLALMMLLLHHRDTVLTDDFFERLFPNSSHENRSQMLRNLTSALRRTFVEKGFFDAESGFLTKGDTGYRLNLGTHGIDYFCDAEAFEQLIAEARRAHFAAKSGGVDISPDTDAARHYRAALDLYKGTYLPDARFEPWAEFKRSALQEAQVEALVFLAETHYAAGDFIDAAALCEQAIAFSPTLAPAYELLIRSYLARHLYAEARHVYQRCREAFRKELNTYPPARIEKLATAELTRTAS